MVEDTEDVHGLPPMEGRPCMERGRPCLEEMMEEMGDVHSPPLAEKGVGCR